MPRHHFTVAEEDQCGDALNLVSITGLRIGIHLELADADAIAVVARHPIHQRSDQSAGAAPGSPEIDEDRAGSLENFTFKTSVGEIGNSSSQGTQMTELILWKAGRLSWVDQSLSMDRFKSSSSASTSSTCTGFTASEVSDAGRATASGPPFS